MLGANKKVGNIKNNQLFVLSFHVNYCSSSIIRRRLLYFNPDFPHYNSKIGTTVSRTKVSTTVIRVFQMIAYSQFYIGAFWCVGVIKKWPEFTWLCHVTSKTDAVWRILMITKWFHKYFCSLHKSNFILN